MRMRYVDELTFGEIAAVTGRPEPTERSTHARALTKLRDLF
jgi:DNA-directed RNA polymerase specialized sigma24 family protein